MSAQFVGLVSHVPGGLGVFEAAMLLLVPAELARYPIIGALALFRVIYYLVPLAAASIMLGLSELRHLRRDGGSGGGPGPR
jgi:phosphatidylglycerol lysyltransferase